MFISFIFTTSITLRFSYHRVQFSNSSNNQLIWHLTVIRDIKLINFIHFMSVLVHIFNGLAAKKWKYNIFTRSMETSLILFLTNRFIFSSSSFYTYFIFSTIFVIFAFRKSSSSILLQLLSLISTIYFVCMCVCAVL